MHGMSKSAEYRIYQGMHQRCSNPKNPGYPNYGGRGIIVDSRWNTFIQFYQDMGPRPTTKHSLDRINNNGPYSQENCRWATHIEQHRNNRRNHLLTIDGNTHCLSEWEEITGASARMIAWRIQSKKPPMAYLATKEGKAHGSRNGNAKLTENIARTLYALKGTMKQRDAANIFGIHQTVVGDIWRQKTWKHIHGNASTCACKSWRRASMPSSCCCIRLKVLFNSLTTP
jgi:hypothetical protein